MMRWSLEYHRWVGHPPYWYASLGRLGVTFAPFYRWRLRAQRSRPEWGAHTLIVGPLVVQWRTHGFCTVEISPVSVQPGKGWRGWLSSEGFKVKDDPT